MKIQSIIFSLFFVCCSVFAFSQDFEGVITMTSSAAEGLNATFSVKGDEVLMEAKAKEGDVKMLSNGSTGIFYIMVDKEGEKLAMKNDLNSPMMKMALSQIESTSETSVKDKFNIQITNETKMIDGYKCVKVTGSNDEGEGYAWVAKALTLNFEDLFPQLKMVRTKSPYKNMQDALGVEGFVMELYSKEKATGKEFTMNAKVDKKSISNDVFKVIEEYEVWDMTDMMKLMQEAQKDPQKMQKLQEMMKGFGNNR